jgi:hypothetical protein
MLSIYGHPRSGTHFAAASIAYNFFNDKEYLKYYAKSPHKMKHKLNTENVIYVKRNFEDVAKSIYKIKDRFGLDVNDFDTFLSTRYADMLVPKRDFVIKVNNRTKVSYRKDVSTNFRNVKLTPKEYWERHLQSWKNSKAVIFDYDKVMADFDNELKVLAKKLNIPIVNSGIITEKVGWFME